MATDLTIVLPVWDQHTQFLPRCLRAIHNEPVSTELLLVDNASAIPLDEYLAGAHQITLADRCTIGAARNAGLAHVTTPFVVFADADDEIMPGSLRRSLTLLQHDATAAGVVGRSLVHEHDHYRRGRTPRTTYQLASRHIPSLVPFFWLAAFQCSITSTILRTASVRDASGFADADIAEDWQLAARLTRRGHFICLDQPIRIYHRHDAAARIINPHQPTTAQRHTICNDCIHDPRATAAQRLVASLLRHRVSRHG